ncbi:hypothetical protein [Halobellus limi]|uniref:hypothetical protein n=1 Tax=Halobellus limi TaxID=699433 RepID=UPI0010A36AA0|nr:hypothetical protein [Halobellus limi]
MRDSTAQQVLERVGDVVVGSDQFVVYDELGRSNEADVLDRLILMSQEIVLADHFARLLVEFHEIVDLPLIPNIKIQVPVGIEDCDIAELRVVGLLVGPPEDAQRRVAALDCARVRVLVSSASSASAESGSWTSNSPEPANTV